MNLANVLRKIAVKLELCNNCDFGCPVEIQKKYINHFSEPENDFQRSYFQYKCQMRFYKPIVSFMLNIFSIPFILLYMLKKGAPQTEMKKNAVFFADGKPENIIPDVLRKKIGNIELVSEKKECITKDDRLFIINLWKHTPFSFLFILKCLLKVRYYSYEIHKNHVKSIIVCNEYSFTSSVLTEYCKKHGALHVNVMHGEKLFNMRDSFFHFHECYVWDNYYKELFLKMRAESTQFMVAVPPSLIISEKALMPKTIEYTYYLAEERGKLLANVVEIVKKLKKNGLKVAIRPHPRFTNMKELSCLAGSIEIENFKKITIEQSLKRTKNAISLYSTVLNQSYNNAIGVVIDDVSDKDKYNLLRERAYIMLNKPHKLLSQLLEMNV